MKLTWFLLWLWLKSSLCFCCLSFAVCCWLSFVCGCCGCCGCLWLFVVCRLSVVGCRLWVVDGGWWLVVGVGVGVVVVFSLLLWLVD